MLFFFFISTFAHVIEWRYFTLIINVFFDNKGVIEHTLNDGFTVRVWQYVPTEVRQPLVQYSSLDKTYWAIKSMESMPMSDPLRNIQLLPGVQTTSENTGGTSSLRWQRDIGNFSMDNRLYYTAYQSHLDVVQTDSRAFLPAQIQTLGAKSEQRYLADCGFFTYGGELMYHVISPQTPQISGSYGDAYTSLQLQEATEGPLFFQSDFMPWN